MTVAPRGECELCDEASHSPGGCGDHDDVARLALHAAHGTHRGLCGNTQASGDVEADGGGFGDNVRCRGEYVRRECPVFPSGPGSGAQEADNLVAHAHVAH